MKRETTYRIMSVAGDYLASVIGMFIFNAIRAKSFSVPAADWSDFVFWPQVLYGELLLPLFFLPVYYISGYYYDPVFRSRISELLKTISTTFFCAIAVYFAVLINDHIDDRGSLFELVGTLWLILFCCLYVVRISMTTWLYHRAYNSAHGFKTVILGTSESAKQLYQRILANPGVRKFDIIGFVSMPDTDCPDESLFGFPVFQYDDLEKVISDNKVEQIIATTHPNGARPTVELINSLFPLNAEIYVPLAIFYIISGRMGLTDVIGEPLINVSRPGLSPMEASVKRSIDLVVSLLALILLLPVFLILALAVKIDSKGPVLYSQERVGLNKIKFKILKFRTMKVDAEADGPSLSSTTDPRVTRIGHFLRKYRLDELPQFWNVMLGQMSIVGPRPEREFYINQIIKQAPQYSLVHRVRPGLTSLGMVKFGYATDVNQMIDRLRYDLAYINHISLGLDLKIIFYTVKTVLTGRGI